MLQMFLPIQLPTLWDAFFIEFSLAHFLWLSYQPTRASSFLKYSANLKVESRFWENMWFFPQAFQRTTQTVDHWGLWNLNFVKTKNWKLVFISTRLPSPVVAKWRIVSSFDMTSIFYGEKLEILKLPFTNFFFHSAQGLSIPKWCFLGNIFSRKTWRMSEMGDPWDVTFIFYHVVAIELLVQYHQQGIIVVKHQRFKSLGSPSSTPVV